MTNIRFENFYIEGAGIGPNINQDSGNNSEFPASCPSSFPFLFHHYRGRIAHGWWTESLSGTSNMLISNIAFVNFTGFLASSSGDRTAQISCSKRHPCYNITMEGIHLRPTAKLPETGAQGSCKYIQPGGVHGMTGSGCQS